jgi:hypothetical protein
VEYSEYYRCCVVGRKKARIMAYDPRRPHAERYVEGAPHAHKSLLKRIRLDAIKLCRGLGYEINTVEFAVERGKPYAIDFMNPVPDADPHSIGQANFDWMVKEVADLAISRAKSAPQTQEMRGRALLGGDVAGGKAARKKPAAKKKVIKPVK